jgi:hypothetical protein
MEKGIEHGISLVEKIRRVKKKLLFDGKKTITTQASHFASEKRDLCSR